MAAVPPGPFRKWWRAALSLLLCAAALSAGVLTFVGLASLRQPPDERETVEKVYHVEVFDVSRRQLREIVSAYGTAVADREVIVSAQVSGEVIEVHPRLYVGNAMRGMSVATGPDGQSVRREGDLLVRVDPATYRERVADIEAQLAADTAELNRLAQEHAGILRMLKLSQQDIDVFREEFERVRKLSGRGVAAESQLTESLLQLKKYEQSLAAYENERDLFPLRREQIQRRQASHQAQLELARQDLQRTEIRAPFDGTLSEVLVDPGQYLRTGDPLVRLTDLRRVEVPLPVTLKDYAFLRQQIAAGRHPRCVLSGNESSGVRWSGTVVRAAPQADETTRTVLVFVQVDNAGQEVPLLPGTFVQARIDGPVHQNVVAIPRDALLDGRVFLADGGRARAVTLKSPSFLESLVLLKSELTDGQQIILTNLDVIHAGAAIEIEQHHSLEEELQRLRVPAIQLLSQADNLLEKPLSPAETAGSEQVSRRNPVNRPAKSDSP